MVIASRAVRALFIQPPADGTADEYEDDRYTGGLIVADWYQRLVRKEEAEQKAAAKSKKKR